VRATLELMQADARDVTVRSSYNLAGISFTPAELAAAIARHVPGFHITYEPDFRQRIAETWPQSIDDRDARRDWGWRPRVDLDEMVVDMLHNIPLAWDAEQLSSQAVA
jgi:nucleoside-diphosphate-sugar epimerase